MKNQYTKKSSSTTPIVKVSLRNAEKLADKHPDTFTIPSLAVRTHLQIGDSAKVSSRNERFWVEVVEVLADRYIGEVASSLVTLPIPMWSAIAFGPEHIISVMSARETEEVWRRRYMQLVLGGSYCDDVVFTHQSANNP